MLLQLLYVTYLFIALTGTVTDLTGMQNNIYEDALSKLPEHVYYTVLQALSTKQLLKYREVNKQAQKRAKHVLINDYSKKLVFSNKLTTPLLLVKKVSNIRLYYGNTDTLEYLANTDIVYLKVLSIYTQDKGVPSDKRYLIARLFAQLLSLIKLKVVDVLGGYCLADSEAILKALSVSPFLKKLDITTQIQALWPALIRLISGAPNLKILYIDNSGVSIGNNIIREPLNTELLLKCIDCLQTLKNLKKFTLHTRTLHGGLSTGGIGTTGVLALARVLPTLTQLRYINLSQNALNQESVQLLQNSLAKLPALQKLIVHSHYYLDDISNT